MKMCMWTVCQPTELRPGRLVDYTTYITRFIETCATTKIARIHAMHAALLFLFCYERDFMLSLSGDKEAETIEAFKSTSRYLDV